MNPFYIVEGFIKLSMLEIGVISNPSKLSIERMNKCIGCEFGANKDKNKWDKFCMSCGCYAPAKVLVDKESCPIGKW